MLKFHLAAPLIGLLLLPTGALGQAEGIRPNFWHSNTSTHGMQPHKPPHGAVVLFNGRDTSAWVHRGADKPCAWTVTDGVLEVKPGTGDIVTRQLFRDYQLHVEFATPYLPNAHSQERGNSGVYQLGHWEIQVLDSYNNPTYKAGGCGAIYGQKDPDQNVCRPPLEWQTYDVTFHAARLNSDGSVLEKPRLTLIWNGVKVHDNVRLEGASTTSGMGGTIPVTGPILLQDHGCKVRYRNIWIKPLADSRR